MAPSVSLARVHLGLCGYTHSSWQGDSKWHVVYCGRLPKLCSCPVQHSWLDKPCILNAEPPIPSFTQCLKDYAQYLLNNGSAVDGQHAASPSWFWWAWNANSGDTGGIVSAS